MKFFASLTLCSILFVGCKKREAEEAVEAPISIQDSEITSSSLKAARVVAYRFGPPDEVGVLREPRSLISRDGHLDIDALKHLTKAEVSLTPYQVSRLVDAVYGSNEETAASACYDPHHIFLFYDNADVLINVVEVCFSCVNLRAKPEIKETQWYRYNFRELARLCDEVGIGMTSGTAEDQIRLWDEGDKL